MGSGDEKITDNQPSTDVLIGPHNLCLDSDLCFPGSFTATSFSVNPPGNAPPEDILRIFSEQ